MAYICYCRKGFVELVHFLIKSGRVSADFVDAERRSLVFLAVLHKKSNILSLLLTHVSIYVISLLHRRGNDFSVVGAKIGEKQSRQ